MSFNPTPTRIGLARAIEDGVVKRHRTWGYGRSGDTIEYKWGHRRINAEYEKFDEAGFVTLDPPGRSMHHSRTVRLTDAGRAWLAEHGG